MCNKSLSELHLSSLIVNPFNTVDENKDRAIYGIEVKVGGEVKWRLLMDSPYQRDAILFEMLNCGGVKYKPRSLAEDIEFGIRHGE